jgi:Skp family chaperone for outer membrane proteins
MTAVEFHFWSSATVKNLLISLALAAGLCGSLIWLPGACGQNDPASARTAKPATGSRIAFVDLGLILRQYKKTDDLLQGVKGQVEASNARIKQLVGEGQEMEKPLRDGTLEKESPEFIELEKKIVKLSTNVSAFKSVKEREFKRSEAKALLTIYKDATEAVRQFAEQNGYTLVLRIDHDTAKSYATIQQTMNQLVVRHESRDDISDDVVAWLNKQYTAAGVAAGHSAAPSAPTAGSRPPTTRSSPIPRDVPDPGARKATSR